MMVNVAYAKEEYATRILKYWSVPTNSHGKVAHARVTLNESGMVSSILINSDDAHMKETIRIAVMAASPYPMPLDPQARKEAQLFNANFIAK